VHIQAHLDQDLSLDALASHVGLSKYHFHELFKSATGETPKIYVERLLYSLASPRDRRRRLTVPIPMPIATSCEIIASGCRENARSIPPPGSMIATLTRSPSSC